MLRRVTLVGTRTIATDCNAPHTSTMATTDNDQVLAIAAKRIADRLNTVRMQPWSDTMSRSSFGTVITAAANMLLAAGAKGTLATSRSCVGRGRV